MTNGNIYEYKVTSKYTKKILLELYYILASNLCSTIHNKGVLLGMCRHPSTLPMLKEKVESI
jgi:hypothetical protein